MSENRASLTKNSIFKKSGEKQTEPTASIQVPEIKIKKNGHNDTHLMRMQNNFAKIITRFIVAARVFSAHSLITAISSWLEF